MPASTDEPGRSSRADRGPRTGVRPRVLRFVRKRAERYGPGVAPTADLQRAEPLVAQALHGDASLLWTGDKRVFFSGCGNAFLMFQIRGRSWVVMGDPIGAPDEFDDLISRFIAECDRHAGRPVFYCVRDHNAERYRRAGLRLLKLGEEAVVDLTGFSMQGSHRAKLRSELRAAAKLGCSVEVLDPQDVRPILPELRDVSDAWLAARKVKEKSFSLGAFDEDYVARFPVAVTRQHGKIIAFASLWASGGRGELKVDLMRRRSDTPRTVMSQLFVESMLWAQGHDYSSFSLGMAPLSGLCTEDAAPFWERVGHFLHSHGESFYNFRGLRQFKVRFKPDWQPRYIASRGGPAMPMTILNVVCLVGGGLRGVVPVAAVSRPSKKKPESEQTTAALPPTEAALVGVALLATARRTRE